MTTGIQWTDVTWNPIAGCSMVSPGCTNCYAMKQAHRNAAMGMAKYTGLTQISGGRPVWTGKVRMADRRTLEGPLHRKIKTRYFVNSMSDLFHEDVTGDQLAAIFGVMVQCPQHTFQILTKRSLVMRDWMNKPDSHEMVAEYAKVAAEDLPWPPKNVWLGVSAESQERADERVPDLLQTRAAVRFVSAEPLLGPIDFARLCGGDWDAMTGRFYPCLGEDKTPALDWVIVGGESGHGARDCNVDWVWQIAKDCRWYEVPVFVKQLGRFPVQELAEFENSGWPDGTIQITPKDDPKCAHLQLHDPKGGNMEEWPRAHCIREFPEVVYAG